MSATLSLLLLTLGLASSTNSSSNNSSDSGKVFECPRNLPCNCTRSDIGSSDLQITCPKAIGSSELGFELNVRSGEEVRVRCRNNDSDWSDFLLGESLEVGEVESLVLDSCSPLDLKSGHILVQRLGIKFESLRYDGLRAKLSASDLQIFPEIKNLELADNDLSNADKDLLREVPHLEYLGLRNTNISISAGFFNRSSSLRSIELGSNCLQSLEAGVFDGLGQLRQLSLWSNELPELQPRLLRNLSSLGVLSLQYNNYRSLPVELFRDLESLENVSLSRNNLSSLPGGLFRRNPKLRAFELLDNRCGLPELPSSLLADLPRLSLVALRRSGLVRLPEDLLWNSTGLRHLDLSLNLLEALPAKLLRDAAGLQELSVAFNRLLELPDRFFSAANKLLKLDLSLNRLSSLNENSLEGLSSLTELNIENNNLKFIHTDAFMPLEQLKILKLANNQLTLQSSLYDMSGPMSPFYACTYMEELYLSHNNITEVFSDWVLVNSELRKLDLSHNFIKTLRAEDLKFISNNIEVDLRHNNIRHVDLAKLELIAKNAESELAPEDHPNRNVRLNLHDNPLECGCKAYNLLRYMSGSMSARALAYAQLDIPEVRCEDPRWPAGARLNDVPPEQMLCPMERERSFHGDPCNGTCDCWFRPAVKELLVNCSSRRLNQVPEFIDARGAESVRLDLSYNQIYQLPDMQAVGYEKVRSLDLAGNRIEAIAEDLITPNLEVLKLDGNHLTFVQSMVLEKLSNISELTLHENPWQCDCNARDLIRFIRSNSNDHSSFSLVTCGNIANVSLSELSVLELCFNAHRYPLLLTSLMLLGLLSVTLVSLYRRLARLPKRDVLYDAFVGYSGKDEALVSRLVARLECHYKLCTARTSDPWHLERALEASGCAIILLSRNLLENDWSEFGLAYGQLLGRRRESLVLVAIDDVGPVDLFDPEKKAYLQLNTYISWNDPWFFQKLVYAIHRANEATKRAHWTNKRDIETEIQVIS